SLAPGATTNGPASSQGQQRMGGARNTFALNVAGQRVHYNHYTLDGIENTDPNFNTYLLLPSIDALQEFNVESAIFQAQSARSLRSTSPPRVERTAPTAPHSSSCAIPHSMRRISSIAATLPYLRSNATNTV